MARRKAPSLRAFMKALCAIAKPRFDYFDPAGLSTQRITRITAA